MKRLIRRAIFASMWSAARKPFTSAAILTSKSVGSKAVIRATPETPSRRFRQYVSKSLPIGMTAPSPVTTARRAGSALGGTGEVLRERVVSVRVAASGGIGRHRWRSLARSGGETASIVGRESASPRALAQSPS
jgi:hypothetical protein